MNYIIILICWCPNLQAVIYLMGNEFTCDEVCRDVLSSALNRTHVGCKKNRDDLVKMIEQNVKKNSFGV